MTSFYNEVIIHNCNENSISDVFSNMRGEYTMKEQTKDRRLILFGTLLAQFGLGTIYTWSLFNQHLATAFGWNLQSVTVTFSITSFALAFATLFAGKLQDKIGIRKLITICGIVFGIGLILTSFISTLPMLYLTAGVIVGVADGIAYISTLSNCIKWFPENKGVISGISVGAYGMGSLIFRFVDGSLLSHFGVSKTFFDWGILGMIFIVLGAQFLADAPFISSVSKSGTIQKEFSLTEMLKTKEFYFFFIIFFSACMSGLYLIGVVKDIGVQLAGLTPLAAANAVAMVAVFNTIGRLILGALSDKLGRLNILIFTMAVTLLSVFTLSFFTLTFTNFFLCVASIAFCFGGNITVFPTIIGDFFGINNQTKNYGLVYQGFGLGALGGSFVAALAGSFKATFIIVAALCILSICLIVTIKISEKRHHNAFSHSSAYAQGSI